MAMNIPPMTAHGRMTWIEPALDVGHLSTTQSIDLSQQQRPVGALQLKHHFAFSSHHMHMCWPVVVGEDDDTVLVETVNGWHST
jgi:hypothetical protein